MVAMRLFVDMYLLLEMSGRLRPVPAVGAGSCCGARGAAACSGCYR
jgi:hypothetical protein